MEKTVYFDFDGTLHDTAYIYRNAVQSTYEYLQTQIDLPERLISQDEAAEWLGLSPPAMWEKFLPQISEKIKIEASAMVGNTIIKQINAGDGKLYAGVPELLIELKCRGYMVKILSNCKVSYKKAVMKFFKLDKLIKKFIAAESYQYKPKNQILAESKGIDENIVAFIGDRKSDIDAGLLNNIVTIACDYGYGTQDELTEADCHIENITELLDLLI
jgi:phosphoglycolate phosphatase